MLKFFAIWNCIAVTNCALLLVPLQYKNFTSSFLDVNLLLRRTSLKSFHAFITFAVWPCKCVLFLLFHIGLTFTSTKSNMNFFSISKNKKTKLKLKQRSREILLSFHFPFGRVVFAYLAVCQQKLLKITYKSIILWCVSITCPHEKNLIYYAWKIFVRTIAFMSVL